MGTVGSRATERGADAEGLKCGGSGWVVHVTFWMGSVEDGGTIKSHIVDIEWPRSGVVDSDIGQHSFQTTMLLDSSCLSIDLQGLMVLCFEP